MKRNVLLLALLLIAACQNGPAPLKPNDVPNVLRYEQTGDGQPVIFIQGANLPMEMWDPQVEYFAPQYQVVRFDVRGFGGSARGDEVQYQSHSDLLALLDHLRIERAHLVGLSLGGRIAVDFALTYPDRVASLVLASPGLSGYQWDNSMSKWIELIIAARTKGDFTGAADVWLQTGFMAPAMEKPELAPRLTELARSNARVWAAARNLEVPLSPPAVNRLGEIHAPTLLLLGERDVEDEHRIVESLHREIPNAQLQVFPGVGHVINLEAPEEFNRIVYQFLRGRGK